MITGLLLEDTFKIEVDKYNRISLPTTKVSLKEIPYVRYRFKEISEDVMKYIMNMKHKFYHSVHIIDVDLSTDFNKLMELEDSLYRELATILTITIDDNIVENGFTQEMIEQMKTIKMNGFDRVVFKDESSNLYTDSLLRLQKQFNEINGRYKGKNGSSTLGLCNSPITTSSTCCLSAEKCRELAAEFGTEETAVASSNHEASSACGCVRYFKVLHDMTLELKETKKESIITTLDAKPKTKSVKRTALPDDVWF